jgi:hypothetical protein
VDYSTAGNAGFITVDKPVYENLGNLGDCPTLVDSFSIQDADGSTTDSDGEDYAITGFAVEWDDTTKIQLTPSKAAYVGQTFTLTIGAKGGWQPSSDPYLTQDIDFQVTEPCSSDDDCTDLGWYCVSSICASKTCTDGSECSRTTFCESGFCAACDFTDNQCEALYTCQIDSICWLDECVEDADCLIKSEYCNLGQCTSKTCSINTDCSKTDYCESSMCAVCTNSAQCDSSDEVCFNGACLIQNTCHYNELMYEGGYCSGFGSG